MSEGAAILFPVGNGTFRPYRFGPGVMSAWVVSALGHVGLGRFGRLMGRFGLIFLIFSFVTEGQLNTF